VSTATSTEIAESWRGRRAFDRQIRTILQIVLQIVLNNPQRTIQIVNNPQNNPQLRIVRNNLQMQKLAI
jgi:hypothetical protein